MFPLQLFGCVESVTRRFSGLDDEDSDDEGIGETLGSEPGSGGEEEAAAAAAPEGATVNIKKKRKKKKKKPRTSSLNRGQNS